MRAVEHDHRRTRRTVILLMHVEVSIFEIDRDGQTLSRDRGKERRVYIEIDRVTELILLRAERGFDAGVEIVSFVSSDRRFAETAEKFLQRFVTKKVEPLFRDFEFDVSRKRLADLTAAVSIFQLSSLLLRNFF
jgi:hypothetical protein